MEHKYYLSTVYYVSACIFTEELESLEADFATIDGGDERATDRWRHKNANSYRAKALGTIMFATACLEAVVNEILLDADRFRFPNGVGWTVAQLAKELERLRITQKYNLILRLCRAEEFDKAALRVPNLLVELRNELTHYKGHWTEWDISSLEDFGPVKKRWEALSGQFNPGRVPIGAFFPVQCLSAGCARWAIDACDELVREFRARLGLPPSEWPSMSTRL